MIITVTMNPAIDKTAETDRLQLGGLNRLKNIISDAGGKGINVSKTIKALGGNSVATGFLGGSSGSLIEDILKGINIKCDFVHINDCTRTNLKIVDSNLQVTELNEPGPKIEENELISLIKKLESYANKDNIFVFSGSVPNCVDKQIYKTLIKIVKLNNAKTFLDAADELFINALDAVPDIVKPNRFELETMFGLKHKATQTELIEMGEKLLNRGIKLVVISLGNEGAIFIKDNTVLKCNALKVKANSTVGAGDSMVAALAYSIDNNIPFEEAVKLSVATSAGAVTTIGTKPPSLELVREFEKQVQIIKIK